MNEFELIQALTKELPAHHNVFIGPGDDCAVLDLGIPERYVLFKTDAVVEGIHFESTIEPEKVGHKALGRCLSDVAAMGGDPTAALITLALPAGFDAGWVQKVYDGIQRLGTRYDVAVAGGETTTNPSGRLISVSLVGTVPKARCISRTGAKLGDAIFVTGELGGSILGKHLQFQPRINEGKWLAANFGLHCMIDLSDGLAGDLRHLLRPVQLGAELLSEAIPVSRAAKLQAREGSARKPPLLAALSDGEDFELLFTVAASDAVRLLDAWNMQFPELGLSCIGKIVTGSAIKLRDREGVRELKLGGYTHFEKASES